jgi:FMN phosphatase YigB (HAD superfamily)
MKKGIIFDWVETLAQLGGVGLFPYSERILRELKEKEYSLNLISIATNNNQREEEIKNSGLISYFDKIIISDNKKIQQYIECIKAMGTMLQDTIIVDDRTVRGIKIGNWLGCQTIWIKKGTYENEIPNEETGEPDKIINTIEELLTIL